MKHIGLFEGIGGFSLAAMWMGWSTVAWCEWNPYCQKLLKQHFPNAEGFGDITKTDFTKYANTIDILSGGFPCQPYSLAGKRKGKEDERHLWPEMLRAVREIQPPYIVGENVLGLLNWNRGMVFDEVQTNLEAEGYEVFPYVLPACSINAPHRRDRIWFIAYSNSKRLQIKRKQTGLPQKKRETLSSTKRGNGMESKIWGTIPGDVESIVCRADHGISNRVDRIKALGNAIVPQVALQIFKAIALMESEMNNDQPTWQ